MTQNSVSEPQPSDFPQLRENCELVSVQGESEVDVKGKTGLISYYWTSSVSSSLPKVSGMKTWNEPVMGTPLGVQEDCSGSEN